MRAEYKSSDFPEGMVRGKYAKRIQESPNEVVLKPEVTVASPNDEAAKQLEVTKLFGSIDYDESYDYKEQRKRR